MTSSGKLICFLPMIWLAMAQGHAAEPVKPEAGASAKAKAAATAKAKSKPKSKPKSAAAKSQATTAKPQAKAAKPQATTAKLQTKAAKPQATVAKPKATAAKPPAKAKPLPNEEKPVRAAAVAPAADQASIDASTLDMEIAAARRAVTENPADSQARERLARTSVRLIDALLHAESVGDVGRVNELTQKLATDLPDTGWRVQKMAQNGDLSARQATGFLLERGVLLEKDANKACAEFLLAAEQFASAGWHAAQCLMKASPDKAWAQVERAAARGHAAAQEWMGRRCLGEFGAAEKDDACARSWLAQAASQGRSRSQTLLAYLLMSDQGGPADSSRAARLYKLAAEQGDADAQNNLGEIYEVGHGTTPNPAEALHWYELAAGQGLASAQFNAGRLWAVGVGDKKDPARARALLVQAESNGVAQAREVLNWLDRQYPPASPAVPDKAPAAAVDASKTD
jgi:TPR repeat protein